MPWILREAAAAVRAMNTVIAWTLVVLALAAGYLSHGWRGLVLALTVVVFWLLLQFSRALRLMRQAAQRPIGQVDNAVMLHARLRPGLTLAAVMKITGSLGHKRADEPETYAWGDAGGDEVWVQLRGGRVGTWQLRRGPPPPAS